jgi:Mrp family chromosome partitioning ATPase
MLSKVARDYDLVIVDCPPVLGIAETVEISRFVDGTILVVSAQKPSGEAVSATVNAIRSANGQILGVVMNRVSEESSGYGYGYGYGYGADAGTLDAQPATTGTHS